MKVMKKPLFALVLALSFATLAGCADQGEFAGIHLIDVASETILSRSPTFTLVVGESQQFKAMPNEEGQKFKGVWESTDPSVITVNSAGYVTAIGSGAADAIFSIEAEDINASIHFNVMSKEEAYIDKAMDYIFETVTLEDSAQGTVGTDVNYTARLYGENDVVRFEQKVSADGVYNKDLLLNSYAVNFVRLPATGGYYGYGQNVVMGANNRPTKFADPVDYTIYRFDSAGGDLFDLFYEPLPSTQVDLFSFWYGPLGHYIADFDAGAPNQELYTILENGNVRFSFADGENHALGAVSTYWGGVYDFLKVAILGQFLYSDTIGQFEFVIADGEVTGIKIWLAPTNDAGKILEPFIESDLSYFGEIRFSDLGTTQLPQDLIDKASGFDTQEKIDALDIHPHLG